METDNLLKQFTSAMVQLNPKELAAGKAVFTVENIPGHQTIFKAGDEVKKVNFLVQGVGRYYYIDENGNEKNKSLVKAGGAFTSLSSLIHHHKSPFYAQTLTSCVTLNVDYQSLIELSEQFVGWARFVRSAYEVLVLKKEKREADFLLLDATQRYQEFIKEFGEESQKIPLKHVAMYIGVTDVSLSRIRKQLGLT
ncbi:Crp/Fnr family transcriptional regulator [Thalassotalea marina]|nr:Crp/Fnr family transcriptional regulator [Thalassotalea marina]